MIFEIIVMVVAIEAITEIIVDGDIFFKTRNFLARINPWFLGELLKCGYCLSVWVAIPFGLAIGIKYTDLSVLFPQEWYGIYYMVVLCVAWLFFLHRVSNIIHELFKRLFDRYPFVLLHQKVNMGDEPEADIASVPSELKESTTETQDGTTEKKSDGSANTQVAS